MKKSFLNIAPLKAISLVEVLVAITLLSIVLVFTISISSSVAGSEKSLNEMRADYIIDQEIISTQESAEYIDQTQSIHNMLLNSTFVKYNKSDAIIQGTFTITDGSTTLSSASYLFTNPISDEDDEF